MFAAHVHPRVQFHSEGFVDNRNQNLQVHGVDQEVLEPCGAPP